MPEALYKFVSIPESQAISLRETTCLGAEMVSFTEALGQIVAEDVLAPEPLPPFPASIKDGYAVRYSEGAGDYVVAFEALAGTAPSELEPGLVAYICTGAAVPTGADAVVQIENTELLPPISDGRRRVRIKQAASKVGEDIRPVGSDIKAGDQVLRRGDLIDAAEIGLLATVGAATIKVVRRPLVAVMSTGDELMEPNASQLGEGKIRDANRPMLLAAASAAGCKVLDLGIAVDRVAEVESRLEAAIKEGADVLITSGGVSMGDKDLVKPLLERQGKVHFGKVRMKPGKPLTFATLDVPCSASIPDSGAEATFSKGTRRMLVFGLPGNPVSSIVTFKLVVLPVLRKLGGWQEPGLRRVHARTQQDLKLDAARPEYHRATLTWNRRPGGGDSELQGEFSAGSTGGQLSSRLLSMRSANALLELHMRVK
ncbi:hypothetical protein WJX84_007092 [Apatococcus fuscideae]|uniref:Molybdopterin biosynthesis protein CNX1 n=1 Tax=Apatococcus fuscideae TaxID=2026836 RepID=A0AAW1STA1_9CHLO